MSSKGSTIEERRAYGREAARRWRERYPEKHREAVRRHRAAHPEKYLGYSRKGQRRYYRDNPEKCREQQRRYYNANPDARRQIAYKGKYGFSLKKYNAMLAEQGGVCAICKGPQLSKRRHFAVDHDHVDGRVRGLLCDHCNRGLGCFKDSLMIIERVRSYLTTFSQLTLLKKAG
jgi:hypothetical protein